MAEPESCSVSLYEKLYFVGYSPNTLFSTP
jgi:hypothetical protein